MCNTFLKSCNKQEAIYFYVSRLIERWRVVITEGLIDCQLKIICRVCGSTTNNKQFHSIRLTSNLHQAALVARAAGPCFKGAAASCGISHQFSE